MQIVLGIIFGLGLDFKKLLVLKFGSYHLKFKAF